MLYTIYYEFIYIRGNQLSFFMKKIPVFGDMSIHESPKCVFFTIAILHCLRLSPPPKATVRSTRLQIPVKRVFTRHRMLC